MSVQHRPSASPLLPPQASDDGASLPGWTLAVALLGLAVLLVSTVPAVVARRRLEAAERRILAETRALDEATERLKRDRLALRLDPYVLDRALRDLFEPGARRAAEAGPR